MPNQKHIVQDGEDGPSIAVHYGFPDSSAIWALADNAALKRSRPNEHQLHAGDVLWIPERAVKWVSAKEKAETKFTVTVPRQRIRLVLAVSEGRPLAGRGFKAYDDADALLAEGKTDGDGALVCEVPASTRNLRLQIAGLGSQRVQVGGLDPLRNAPGGGASGCAQRLAALGYDPGARDGSDRDALQTAIRRFKSDAGLASPDDPSLDEPLFAALEQKYGQ